jgi:hypothetical protein
MRRLSGAQEAINRHPSPAGGVSPWSAPRQSSWREEGKPNFSNNGWREAWGDLLSQPLNQQQPPAIVGRTGDNDLVTRAKTKLVYGKTVPYSGGVAGDVTVSIYRSTDMTARGGVVLRITSTCPSGDAFLAHAEAIDGGIELHMAGETESCALLDALREGIAEMNVRSALGVHEPDAKEATEK